MSRPTPSPQLPPAERPARRGREGPVALVASLACDAAAAVLILLEHPVPAGLAALAAGALLVAAARRIGGDLRVRFLERLADRMLDACVLAPLAWVTRPTSVTTSVLALVGLGTGFLASYERARGQALGFRGHEGIPYLATRVALLALALLTGRLVAFLSAFVLLTGAACAVRAWNVTLQARRQPSGARASG